MGLGQGQGGECVAVVLGLLFVVGLLASGSSESVVIDFKNNGPKLPHFPDVPDKHPADKRAAAFTDVQENLSNSLISEICSPGHFAGNEGHGHAGLALEKIYVLIASQQGRKQHGPSYRYSAPPVSCNYSMSASSLVSFKTRTYPEVVQVYKNIGKGRLGTELFNMLPTGSICEEHDLSPQAITEMIRLGEYLFQRYHSRLPVLQQVPEKILKFPACMSSQEFFQSTSALLHGLLTEKQFLRTVVQKLTPDRARGLGTHTGCSSIQDVDIFMQKSYTFEHEVFKDHGIPLVDNLKSEMAKNIGDIPSAKTLLCSLPLGICGFQQKSWNDTNPNINISRDDIRNLLLAVSSHNEYLSTNSLFAAYAVADTYLHFFDLFSWFSGVGQSDGDMKFDVVDDFFLLKFLTVLGYPAKEPIRPGTRLVVEQYRKDRLKSRAKFWKVLLNGRVITDILSSCGGHSVHGVCGADTLRSFWQSLVDTNAFPVCRNTKDEF